MRTRIQLTSVVVAAVFLGTLDLATPAFAANPACSPSSAFDGTSTVLTFTNASVCDWTVPTGVTSGDVLVVAGGGGGAGSLLSSAGGGAGGLIYDYAGGGTGVSLTAGTTKSVTVGTGGAASTSGSGTAGSGTSSTFGALTAVGGGGGGFGNGASGGSGGGAGINLLASQTGGVGQSGQGFKGGDANGLLGSLLSGGGGGGAGGAGGNGGLVAPSGSPGAGVSASITGSAVTYAAGGATVATYQYAGTASSAAANPTIGGGGRANSLAAASAGNNGVVIVRFTTPPTAPVFTASTATGSGTAGAAYSYTYTANGPPSPTFSVSNGTVPAGLTLNPSTGVLSGTPTAAGTYTFKITATNSQGSITTGTQTITVQSAPAFTAAAPPTTATTLVAYPGYTFTASGSPAPTFAVASGALPTGLSLSSAGVLSGTPALVGNSTFTVSATNSVGTVTTSSLTIAVTAAVAPAFVLPVPTTGTVGAAYSYTFTTSGVPTPTFAVSAGTLPAGLSLNTSTGVLSGTPTTAGLSTFTVSATNAAGTQSSGSLSMTVNPANASPVFTAFTAPTTGTVGAAYAGYTFAAAGYPAPTFATASGTLPLGLTLNSLTGVLSGTPLASGASSFTVSATNSSGTVTTGAITVTISPAPAAPLLVLASPTATGQVGVPYSYSYTATGVPTPTFAVASGALPAGLSLSSAGVLAGTPSAAGAASFTVTASNSGGTATSGSSTVTISPANSTPGFTASAVPTTGVVAAAYAGYTFAASGYPAPVYAVASGTLPLGLTLNSLTGVLSGTPVASGASSFTVSATNSSGTATTGTITLTISPAPLAPTLVLATPTATGQVGAAYTYTYTALGVPAPTFSVASGALPAGLSLSSAGVLSGTPSAAGAATFTVTATNASGTATSGSSTVTISPANSAPVFTAATPPTTGTVAAAYAGYTFAASGYPAPVYAVAGGALPLGLTLDPTSGALSGTPLASGASSFTVSATSSSGTATTGTITLTVSPAPVAPVMVAALPPTTGQAGTAYGPYTFTALGVPTPTFSVSSGALPTGLSLTGAGVLAGTPTTAGAATFTVTATNASGTSNSNPITVTVSPANSAPAFVNQSPPTTGTVAAAYAGYTFAASGYPAPVFTVATGTLPTGLTLDPVAGTLSGTPLAAGSYPLTLTATSTSGTATSAAFTITINPAPAAPAFVTSSPPTTATVGTAYGSYLFTALGVPTPTFSLASGALPAGLSLTSAGVLSGTPSTAGVATFTVAASNSTGSATTSALTITVAPTPVVPAFTAAGPPTTGTVGAAYAGYTFAASGTPAPTFSVTAGMLPLGLTLSSAGVLAGTPLAAGSSTITVTATNSAGTANTLPITITVSAAPVTPVLILASPTATGTVGTPYGPYTYTAFGVPTPVFSVASGALPAGLTLSTAGVLSGTPTTAGAASFTVTATNSAGTATSSASTVTIAPMPVAPVFTAAAPATTATVASTYPSYTFTASGVPAPTFAVATGALPLGLTLSSAGVLSGTPLAVGSYPFTVSATNSAGSVTTSSITIAVAATPVSPVLAAALPPTTGQAGTAYGPYTFTAVGVPTPTFSVTSGALPAGLSLTGAGVLAGTPTTAGAATFTVTATNASGTSSSNPITVTISPANAAPTFTAASPPTTGVVGSPYGGYTFAASGYPVPTYTVASGALPAGLTLDPVAGTLLGTPLSAGTSTFTVAATNTLGTLTGASTNNAGLFRAASAHNSVRFVAASAHNAGSFMAASANNSSTVSTPALSITVLPAATAPTFVNQTPTLTGTVGTAYPSYTYTTLGSPVPTFAVGSGALPPGLTLASTTGVLSGTPTTAGTYTFTASATNSSGTATSLPAVVVISPAAAGPAFVNQTPAPTATVATTYSYTFTASGYPAPVITQGTGTLPTGLTLVNGLLTGVPVTAGTYTFTVTATNASGAVSTGSKTITVNPASVAPAFIALDPVTDPVEGMPYSHTFIATGYPTPTYSVTSGALPSGLTLSSAGTLSGTPATGSAGSYPITITATNGVSPDATRTLTLTVDPAPTVGVAPIFISLSPTGGTVGQAYTFPFTATGYPAPTYSVSAGSLPVGLSLDPTTGVLSGTPSTAGTSTFTVTATNSTAPPADDPVTLTVDPAPQAPTFTDLATSGTATVGSAYSYTFTATGTPSTIVFTTTDPLPIGVLLSPTGQLSGTPQTGTAGDYPLTVTATNGTAPAGTKSFLFHVNPGPQAPTFTDAAPAGATVGTPYSHTFTATGNPSTMTFSTLSTLPAGLTLTSGGVLSGTPQNGSNGTYPILVTADNGVIPDGTDVVTLTVSPASVAPTFTAFTPPGATAGQAYSYTFTASGNPSPTFSTQNSLPTGLTLNSNGTLSGTLAAGSAGAYVFTVTATNGVSPDAVTPVALTVSPASNAPAFTADTPPNGTLGVVYPGYQFQATGYPAPTFSALTPPAGLSLSSSGRLTGTPTSAGPQVFTVTASNSVGVAPQVVMMTIGTAPTFTADSPPSTGTAGLPYLYDFAAGGSPAPTFSTPYPLPSGWTLDATTGVLSATSPIVGTFSFSVIATNASGSTTAGPFTVTIGAATLAPTFTDNNTEATTATVGTAYPTYTFTASGIPAPTFGASAGLPPGLTLSSGGVLSGTPTSDGSYTFSVTASNIVPPAADKSVTIQVDSSPSFTAASPPLTGVAGTAYSYQFAASGTPAPTYATLSQLPTGWNLDPTTGVLSAGSPSAGSFTFYVQATNSVGSDVAGPFTITIAAAPAGPAFTADSPPSTGVVATTYGPYTFTASGNPAPTFAITAGNLPAGLTLDATTGRLTGTPTATGTATFTVGAHNSAGDDSSGSLTITVAATATAPHFTASNPPGTAAAGTAYAGYTFAASGSPAPTFSIHSGSLPTGMTLNSQTGALSGTPTQVGTYTVTVSASNSAGTATTSQITITVAPAPATAPVFVADSPPTTGTAGNSYARYTFAAHGNPSPTYSVSSGSLPAGLSLDPTTGVLSGTPSASGSSTFAVTATNSQGSDVSPSITISVSDAGALPAPAVVTLTPGPSSLTATWTTVPGATGYTAITTPDSLTCNGAGTDTSCVIFATAGTSYTVNVVAHFDGGGESAASTRSNPATPTGPSVPTTTPFSAPTTLTTVQGKVGVVAPGSKLTVVGNGFAPHSTIGVLAYSSPMRLATATADADGHFSQPITVPNLAQGAHNIVASGVSPTGEVHLMRLPVTMVHQSETDVEGTGMVPIPVGGQVRLLNPAGAQVTKVAVKQGAYTLNTTTGAITFVADGGFRGKADPVTYRATDTIGTTVEGTYAAVVSSGVGRPGVPVKSKVTATGSGVISVPCTLSAGAIIKCVVTVTATAEGKVVRVGSGAATVSASRGYRRLTVPVALNATGRRLVRASGGAKLTFTAVITQAGRSATTRATRAATVRVSTASAGRDQVQFANAVTALSPAQGAYLVALRQQLKLTGARTITCVGNSETNVAHDQARATTIAQRRAKNVCAVLARALPGVKIKIVTRTHPWLGGKNDTPTKRAADRRVQIVVET